MARQKTIRKTGTKGKTQNKAVKDDWVGLSFRVSPEFAREFKVYAAQNDYKLVDLLKEGFAALKKQNK